MPYPTLYSYRRCPYAMRARMALFVAGVQCQVHEIDFKDKPAAMVEASPKATVPVLITLDGNVIDESLDVMLWALSQNDPESWLHKQDISLKLIAQNDGTFKKALDRYKYANRFPEEDCSDAREQASLFLYELDALLNQNSELGLVGNTPFLADIAIFPFIRQFANVDKAWFDAQNFNVLQQWLKIHTQSKLFHDIFSKKEKNPYMLLG